MSLYCNTSVKTAISYLPQKVSNDQVKKIFTRDSKDKLHKKKNTKRRNVFCKCITDII